MGENAMFWTFIGDEATGTNLSPEEIQLMEKWTSIICDDATKAQIPPLHLLMALSTLSAGIAAQMVLESPVTNMPVADPVNEMMNSIVHMQNQWFTQKFRISIEQLPEVLKNFRH